MSRILLFSAFGSVLLVNAIALIGLVTFRWDEAKLKNFLPIGISIAVGVLLGEAGFHLIPESMAKGLPLQNCLGLVVIGFTASLAIELASRAFLSGGTVAPVARIALFAESIHNAIDGMIIAAAYIAGLRIGIMATLAVAVHELPHELGNFAVLVDAGYPRKRAIWLNLISAGFAFLGASLFLMLGTRMVKDANFILPIAAGCFIYMSVIDLLPSLWSRAGEGGRATIGFGVTAGAGLMLALTFAH